MTTVPGDPVAALFGGSARTPIYIYAPVWRERSAGIKVLHLLCHALNVVGEDAWLVLHNPAEGIATHPGLRTPVLSQAMANAHVAAGLEPIVVYSETVPGNPLRANRVVRYLLNYPGDLGGSSKFDKAELLIAFSENIARTSGAKHVLFLPPIDPRDLQPKQTSDPSLKLLYAGKYRAFIGRPKHSDLPGVTEIFRDGARQQPREQVLQLIAEADVLYCYENSSIATEAAVTGTPVVFVPNEFLSEVIAEHELTNDGYAWGESEEEEVRARATVGAAREHYYAAIVRFWSDLESTVSVLHQIPMGQISKPLHVPRSARLVSRHRVSLALQLFRHQGLRSLLRVAWRFGLFSSARLSRRGGR